MHPKKSLIKYTAKWNDSKLVSFFNKSKYVFASIIPSSHSSVNSTNAVRKCIHLSHSFLKALFILFSHSFLFVSSSSSSPPKCYHISAESKLITTSHLPPFSSQNIKNKRKKCLRKRKEKCCHANGILSTELFLCCKWTSNSCFWSGIFLLLLLLRSERKRWVTRVHSVSLLQSTLITLPATEAAKLH